MRTNLLYIITYALCHREDPDVTSGDEAIFIIKIASPAKGGVAMTR